MDPDNAPSGPAWAPPARKRSEPPSGFHSRGQAQLAEFLTQDYGAPAAPSAPTPQRPVAPPPPGREKPSGALVVFAVIVAGFTVATVVGLLLRDRIARNATASAPASSQPGTNFATLWNIEGYERIEGDPTVMDDMLLDMSFNPEVRGLFRGGDQKVYGRNGSLAAYAIALKLDMAAATDPSVVEDIYMDVDEEATELTVAGHRAVRVDHGEGFYYAAVKRDVLLVLVGETPAAMEPVMAKLLANIA